MKAQHMVMEDVLAAARWKEASPESLEWLVKILRNEGVDLLQTGHKKLRRGTPVFVEASAPVLDVQRAMAESHIRFLPVVKSDQVIGIVDLVELAMADLEPGETVEAATTQ